MRVLIIVLIFSIFFNILEAKEKKFLLTKVTYEAISKAQKLLDENKNTEAKIVLLDLETSSKIKKKLDKAYIRFYIGYFYTLSEESQKAVTYFKKAVAYNSLAPAQVENAYLNIVQLSMELERYEEALIYLKKLINTTKTPKPQYFVTKANVEMILKNYKKVILDINMAIKINNKAKASWLKMKYYSFYMLKDYKDAIAVLKKLIEINPTDKEYWLQLSSLYSVIDNFDKSLSSLDITRIAKLNLNEQELLRLISWLQYSKVPYKAATIMKVNINSKIIKINEKNLNALGDLYYESKEYSQAIQWYKKSAKLNKSSKTYFKIAKIYANERKYEDVILNLKLSLDTKDKKIDGSKYLLLGKAYYELSNLVDARKAFYKAKKFTKSKKMANAWLNYL